MSSLKSLNNWSVSWKWYPILGPKLSDLYTLFQSKLLINHNVHSGSYMYLYSIYGSTLPPQGGKYVLLCVTYLFLEYSCSPKISSVLQNGSYLHHQSSVLFAFKICFDQIFVVGIFFFFFGGGGGFNRRCSYDQAVCAMHFLMWPPLWYNSQLAKNIPLLLNPYPFIQKSPWLLQCIFIMI